MRFVFKGLINKIHTRSQHPYINFWGDDITILSKFAQVINEYTTTEQTGHLGAGKVDTSST
jgi:hypothetical protein